MSIGIRFAVGNTEMSPELSAAIDRYSAQFRDTWTFSAPAPEFSVLGDGAGGFDRFDLETCFILFARDIPVERRAALLEGVPAALSYGTKWLGPLLKLSSSPGPGRVHVGFSQLVNTEFGPGEPVPEDLLKLLKSELKGQRELLRATTSSLKGAAKAGPTRRFYEKLWSWLRELHAREPILFILRPVAPPFLNALTELHNEGVKTLFDGPLDVVAELATSVEETELVTAFVRELVFLCVRDSINEHRKSRLLPLIERANSVDHYANAAQCVLLELSDESLERYLDSLEQRAIGLLLRTDFLPKFLNRPSAATLVRRALHQFWSQHPDVEARKQLAFRISYAIFPLCRHERGAAVLDVIGESIEAHIPLCRWEMELNELVAPLAAANYLAASERLKLLIERMRAVALREIS